MRKTYAYNSIIIGFLIGILVWASAESAILGILAGLGVSVVGFFIIRMFENALEKGVDKVSEKVAEAYHRRQERKTMENRTYVKPNTTQMPQNRTTQFPDKSTAPAPLHNTAVCPYCKAEIKDGVVFCPACGQSVDNKNI